MNAEAIVLESVGKSYGPVRALESLSLRIPVGQCHGLIGANGAGKTTTFSLLCGFLRPSSGRIEVLGQNPLRPGALKGRVGVLPQDAVLPPTWRVGTLLTYWARLSNVPARQAEPEARRCLERVGLAETWVMAAGALSHGMAKRVALAQALLGSPPVLLLDEPTAGLDPKVALQVRALIRDLKGSHTLLISSHNLHELEELCDAATILDRGRMVSSGRMAELTGRTGEFKVQVARGTVPLDAVRKLPGCTGATLGPDGTLRVTYDSRAGSPEEMISHTVQLLLSAGVLILAVTPGHSLEERVLQVT